MIKIKDIMMKHKIASTVKDYGYYKVVQDKLSDRLGVQKKVFKYFKVNDLEELDKKVTENNVFLYMYFDEENDRVAIIVADEDGIDISFNTFMMMLGYRLNIGV